MNVSRAHLLAALRFLDGPDGGGSGGTPPGDNGTPPAGAADGTGGDNGDRGSGDEDDPDDDEDDPKGDRQARRDENTRAKLKEAEAARDTLTAKVEKLQRAEVERIAGGVLEQAADLFEVGGITLADVLDEDGEVDEGAVAAALDQLASTRPGLVKGARLPARGSHVDWGHSRSGQVIGGEGPTWRDALVRTEGSGRR